MSGNAVVDRLTSGFPRGCITEVTGAVSSGRTSLVAMALATASQNQECVAYVDVSDSLDPRTMRQAGVDLDRLLWLRCGGKLERALRVADLVLHTGGFGISVLDLADMPARWARRIPMAYWFRFRRALENKPGCLILVNPVPCAGTCAALRLGMRREDAVWRGRLQFQLLANVRFHLRKEKPGSGHCTFCSRVETGT